MNDPGGKDELRLFLAKRDVGCPACEYNLRGLEVALCPECGAEVDMTVLLITDRGFKRRRRRLVAAWLVLSGVAVVIWIVPLRPLVGIAYQTLGIAAGALFASLAVAAADESIYHDRLRFPRARGLPPFGRVVTFLAAAMLAAAAVQAIRAMAAVI